MSYRTRAMFMCLILLLCFAGAAGCASVRTGNTHNTTVAVQEYNSWTGQQQTTNQTARNAVTRIGDHVAVYNTEIARDRPDLAMLRGNLAQDQQALDQWGADLALISAATDRFEENTSALPYDNASAKETIQTLHLMTQYMRTYSIESENARQHLIAYVNNAQAYGAPDDPDYWNEQYRQDAMQAKADAEQSLANGDLALRNVTVQARQLEMLQ
jgi:hypothetical protein